MTSAAVNSNLTTPWGIAGTAMYQNRLGGFTGVLRSSGATGDQVRTAALQLVASALIEPVLASLHESPFLEGPFAPGDAERRFAPMFDQHLADRITGAANFPLIDLIAARYGSESPVRKTAGTGGIDVTA